MALLFDASGRYVNHGSAASIDDLPATAITCVAWVYRTSDGSNLEIITKDSAFPTGFLLLVDNGASEGLLRFLVFRTNTTYSNWADALSGSLVVPLNTWTMVAATYVFGSLTKLYTGSLTTPIAEVPSYGVRQAGAGAYVSDAGANLYVGNLQRDTTLPFKGRIDRSAVFNRALSLAELQQLQSAWLPLSGCVLMSEYSGTGTQADLSGNGNTGTVVNAVAADDLPLVGIAVETDTALALSGAVGGMSAGRANETDTALALAGVQARAAGLASTADTAAALSGVQLRPAGTASEADSALALAPVQLRETGTASESDTAAALSSVAIAPAGIADESDQALALTAVQAMPAGLSVEADEALALTSGQSGAAGLASESDSASALGSARPAGIAATDEEALALSAVQSSAVGLVAENDNALTLSPVIARATGAAVEIDEPLALSIVQIGAVGVANDNETALALISREPLATPDERRATASYPARAAVGAPLPSRRATANLQPRIASG